MTVWYSPSGVNLVAAIQSYPYDPTGVDDRDADKEFCKWEQKNWPKLSLALRYRDTLLLQP